MTKEQILQKYWGFDAFRPQQATIVQSVVDGHDTLALLPTGGGKSICFQVPAMMFVFIYSLPNNLEQSLLGF